MYIDAHCHLETETYGAELPDVIQRAFDAGLTHLVAVGASRVTLGGDEAILRAESDGRIFASVGIHPHDAGEATEADISRLAELSRHPRVVSVGEIGLDFFYDKPAREPQDWVFRRLIEVAKEVNKPIMLHIRNAHPEAWQVLDEVGLPAAGGMVHCFTGNADEARQYLDRGMMLSIPGIVTFKNAEPLREAVRIAPMDRLMLETDSPYLAPIPHRGQRNEPAFLVATAEAVGALKGVSGAEMGRVAAENTRRLFGIG